MTPTHAALMDGSPERLFPRFVNAMYNGPCPECEDGIILEVESVDVRDDGVKVTTSIEKPCPSCLGSGKEVNPCALSAATKAIEIVGEDQEIEVYAKAAVIAYLERLREDCDS